MPGLPGARDISVAVSKMQCISTVTEHDNNRQCNGKNHHRE